MPRRQVGWILLLLISGSSYGCGDGDEGERLLPVDRTPKELGADVGVPVEMTVGVDKVASEADLPESVKVVVWDRPTDVVSLPTQIGVGVGLGATEFTYSYSNSADQLTLDLEVEQGSPRLEAYLSFECLKDGVATLNFGVSGTRSDDGEGIKRNGFVAATIRCGTEQVKPGGGGEVKYGDPVIDSPCNALEPADVQFLVGHPVTEEPDATDTNNATFCQYKPLGGDGIRLDLRADIKSNADGFKEGWLDQRSDATVDEDMPWSTDGQLLFSNGTASVFAFVRTDDPIGRDIFIRVSAFPIGDAEPAQATLIDTAATTAEVLHDHLLSIQTVVDN